MRAGLNRDNMETMTAREESKKVKGKLNELQPLISQLQAEVCKTYKHFFMKPSQNGLKSLSTIERICK